MLDAIHVLGLALPYTRDPPRRRNNVVTTVVVCRHLRSPLAFVVPGTDVLMMITCHMGILGGTREKVQTFSLKSVWEAFFKLG